MLLEMHGFKPTPVMMRIAFGVRGGALPLQQGCAIPAAVWLAEHK
jgi:hypothetical protein